jgi:hypothetical protein
VPRPKGLAKTGGRQAGTPNKATSEEAQIFEALGGPRGEIYAQKLHEIAALPHNDIHARLKAIALILPYLPWPKLKEADGERVAAIATVVNHIHLPSLNGNT